MKTEHVEKKIFLLEENLEQELNQISHKLVQTQTYDTETSHSLWHHLNISASYLAVRLFQVSLLRFVNTDEELIY